MTDVKKRRKGWLTLSGLVVELHRQYGIALGDSPERTIRFYQTKGLIPRPVRTKGPEGQPNVAYYAPSTVAKVAALRKRLRGDIINAFKKQGKGTLRAVAEDAGGLPVSNVNEQLLFLLKQFEHLRTLMLTGSFEQVYGQLLDDAFMAEQIIPKVRETAK